MTTYLALQSTYTTLELGLYQDNTRIAFAQVDKTCASKECVIVLAALLKQNDLTANDLSFIGVNQGPGPFTTLRVAIATANGLAFARTLPLVGINGMEAFLQEYADQSSNVVALLNAFGSDLYYGMRIGSSYEEGCASIDAVLTLVAQKIPNGPLLLIGNGVTLATQEIQKILDLHAQTMDSHPETVSLDAIAKTAFDQWKNKQNISYQLQPLYFKEAFYQQMK